MEIPVLIEPVAGNGYRASAFSIVAEGATKDETLRTLQALIAQRVAGGAQVARVSVPTTPSWMKYAGTWKPDDPVIEDWKRAVEEFRSSSTR